MSRRAAALAALIATAGGVLAALAAAILPSPHGWLVSAGLACYLVFLVWPWSCIPVAILGGGFVAEQGVPGGSIAWAVMIHSGILLAGALAVLTRWLVAPGRLRRQRTAADPLMLVLAAVIVLGAGYGLARGNRPYLVMVATYELAIVPAYFFVATVSLSTIRAVRSASVLFVGVLVAIGLARPGSEVGLLAALALAPLLACAAAASRWRQAGVLAVCAILAAEVMLSQYRTVWVASGVAVLLLLVCGSARVRTTTGIALVTGGLLLAGAAALNAPVASKWTAVLSGVADSPGYRQAETLVGLRVLVEHPLFGAGLGQTTPNTYLDGFKVIDVGPMYHAFWMVVLANAGLLGLLAFLVPLLLAAKAGLTARSGPALGLAATLCGFLVSSSFAGPTDGHWELGLLAALTVIARTWNNPALGKTTRPYGGTNRCLLTRPPARRTPEPV